MPVVRASIPLLRRKDNSLAFDAVVVGAADRSIPQDPVREDTNMDAARVNVKLMQAWLDAHNRQDMKALDYMSDDVEIVEIPTGVVWRGCRDMENLARLAYSRKSLKRLTRVFATDKEACVEYVTVVSTAGEVSDLEREHGLHGIDISNAKPTVDTFELPVCFVCEIQDGKIRRAREYWDAASLARQLGAPGHQHDSEAPSSQDRSR